MTAGGRTYERSALLEFWNLRERPLDPLTNRTLADARLITNFEKRSEVKSFLDSDPEYIPDGWENREVPPPVEMLNLLPESVANDAGPELARAILHFRGFVDEMSELLLARMPPLQARHVLFFSVFLLSMPLALLAHSVCRQHASPLQQAGDNPEKLGALLITGAREIQDAVVQKMDSLGSDENYVKAFLDAGVSAPLVNYLILSKPGERLGGFSVLHRMAAQRPDIVIQAGAIEAASRMLQTGPIYEKEWAAIILWNMAVRIEHRDRIGNSGAIEEFILCLNSSSHSLRRNAASLIGMLATDNENNLAKSMKAGALESLNLMKESNYDGDRKAAEYALFVLDRSYVRDLFVGLLGWLDRSHVPNIAITCLTWRLLNARH